jgi:hypothetical protein
MRSSKRFLALVSMAAATYGSASAQTSTPVPPGTQAESAPNEDRDSALDLPPLPKGTVSLIGGTVIRVDPIRDRVVLRAFGGRDVSVDFDVRTRILREETPVSTRELRPGARIYADTALVNGRIFAKTIRIGPSAATGEANGQVTAYDPGTRRLKIRNALAAEPLEVQIISATTIRTGERTVDPSTLTVGSLVHVTFRPGDRANQAAQIDILAQPGSTFTFAGKMTFVDLRAGYVAIADQAGANTYEVSVDHLPRDVKRHLKEGTDVVVQAKFDGQKYQAQKVELAQAHSH